MGKATILPSGDKDLERGQYYVRIEKDSTRAEWEIQRLSRDLDSLSGIISTNYSSYQSAQNAHSQAKSDLDQIIQQGKESPSDNANDKIRSATQSERATARTLANARATYQMSRTKEASIRRRIRHLKDQITIEDTRVVWCADCNQTLQEGDSVGTIEIPYTDDSIMIKPMGTDIDGSDYDAEIDGILTHTAALTSAQAFHSYAVFPGWQRWKPTYRLGKILQKTGRDNATILLDAESAVQSLEIDNARYIYNVPLTLKGQKSGPYEIGDRVVVKFEDQNHEFPKVVGFEEDPCTTTTSTTTSTSSCCSTTTTTVIPFDYLIIMELDGGLRAYDGFTTGTHWTSASGPCTSSSCLYRGVTYGPLGIIANKNWSWSAGVGGYVPTGQFVQYDGISATPLSVVNNGVTGVLLSIATQVQWAVLFGTRDIVYNGNDGTMINTAGNNVIVVHTGIGPTVSTTFRYNHPNAGTAAPYESWLQTYTYLWGVTIYNGDLILCMNYVDSLGAPHFEVHRMNGISNTFKSDITPGTGDRRAAAMWQGNIIYLTSSNKRDVHVGLTSTILNSISVATQDVSVTYPEITY